MAIHLDLRHPSPVSALPRRGRKERHGFEALTTPVAIPEAAPGSFMPMPPIEMGQVALYGIHARDGATWTELAAPSSGRGFSAADVLAFARDATHPDADLLGELRAALRFTPLHAGALSITGSHTVEADLPLGDPLWHLEGHALDRVTREERERSAANLRAWIDGNLAVAGDKVMIRTPVLLEVLEWHGRLNVYAITRMAITPHKVDGIRPDRARALCAAMGKPFDDAAMEEGLGLFEEWAKGLSTDDDVRLLAERLPALVQAMAEDAARAPGYKRRLRSPEGVAAALDAIRPWRLRGAIGAIALDEAPAAIAACEAAAAGLREAGVDLAVAFHARGGIFDQARTWYTPRVDEPAPEDVEALALMA